MYLSAEKKWKVRTSDRLFGKMRRWMRSLSVLSSEWEAFSFTSEQSGWKEKVHIIGSRLNSNLLPVLFVFTTCHWHQAMSVFQWDVGGGGVMLRHPGLSNIHRPAFTGGNNRLCSEHGRETALKGRLLIGTKFSNLQRCFDRVIFFINFFNLCKHYLEFSFQTAARSLVFWFSSSLIVCW